MLRAAVVAILLATAYCGAKGPPQPPLREEPDAGVPSPVQTVPASPQPPAKSPFPPDAGEP